jgi:hypothetical protein
MSVVIATFQPLPSPPTMFSSGIRASSRNSSLNSDSPVIWHRVLLHVHEEVGEPLVLGGVEVRARDQHAPLRVVRQRGPHLLSGDQPVVAACARTGIAHRRRLDRREVRARLGLREALAPDLLGAENGLEIALLLLVGTVGDDRRPAHGQAEHVGHLRRLSPHDLLVEDRLLDQGRAPPAVLLGPGQAGPAGLVELLLPVAAKLEPGLVALGLATRVVGVEPGAKLVAKCLLLRREGQVHGGGS